MPAINLKTKPIENSPSPTILLLGAESQLSSEPSVYSLEGVAAAMSSYIPAGPAGPGLPSGGTEGQILAKASSADFDSQWVDLPSGGGGMTFGQVMLLNELRL